MKTSDIGKWIIGVNPRYTDKFGDKWITSDTTGCIATVTECETSCSVNTVTTENVQNQMGDTVSQEAATDGEISQVSDIAEEISVDIEDITKVSCQGAKEHEDIETVAEDIAEICNQSVPGSINRKVDVTDDCNERGNTEDVARVSGRSESSTNDTDEQPAKRVKIDAESGQVSEFSKLEEGHRKQAEVQFEKTSVESVDICRPLTNNKNEQKECDNSTVKITDMSSSVTDTQNIENKKENGSSINQMIELTDVARVVTDPVLVDSKLTVDEFCEDCKYICSNPKRNELILYLHAIRYQVRILCLLQFAMMPCGYRSENANLKHHRLYGTSLNVRAMSSG